METRRKAALGEWVLLGLTGLFLCLLLGLFLRDRAALGAPASVETALTAPAGEAGPDLAPLDLNAAGAEELTALPGIVLQLIFIPAVMVALDRTGLVRFRRGGETVRAV